MKVTHHSSSKVVWQPPNDACCKNYHGWTDTHNNSPVNGDDDDDDVNNSDNDNDSDNNDSKIKNRNKNKNNDDNEQWQQQQWQQWKLRQWQRGVLNNLPVMNYTYNNERHWWQKKKQWVDNFCPFIFVLCGCFCLLFWECPIIYASGINNCYPKQSITYNSHMLRQKLIIHPPTNVLYMAQDKAAVLLPVYG